MALTYDGTAGITFNDGSQLNTASQIGMRNRIINGNMAIDQRYSGASASPTNGQYTVDRWVYGISQSGKLNVQQMNSANSSLSNYEANSAPVGFTNSLKLTSNSAYTITSTDYFYLAQPIEAGNMYDMAWGTSAAATVTLSFWTKSSLTGTFSGSIRNYYNSRAYSFTYTINSANTWQYVTITIPGDTGGTWVSGGTGGYCYVNFNIGNGSTYLAPSAGSWQSGNYQGVQGTTSILSTNSATLYFTGIQLEKGAAATPFEYRHYGTELSLCQRYYQYYSYSTAYTGTFPTTGNNSGVVALGGAANSGRGIRSFKVQMRASPTFLLYGNTGGTSGFLSDISNSTTPAVSYAEGSQDGLTSINFSNTIGVGDVLTGQVSASAEL